MVSNLSLDSASNIPLAANSDVTEVKSIPKLGQFLADGDDSWCSLRHKPAERDAYIKKLTEFLETSIEHEPLSPEPGWLDIHLLMGKNPHPEFCCIGAQFMPDHEVADLTAALAEAQDQYGKYAQETVNQACHLAVTLQDKNQDGEAEYYCRRSLVKFPDRTIIKIRLGLILAKTHRLEESTSLLFSATSAAIAQSRLLPPEHNSHTFFGIKLLFEELIIWGEGRLISLILYKDLVMTLVEEVTSEETSDRQYPQLLVHGLNLAYECSVLDMVDSAKNLYEVLLEHTAHLDDNLYGIERATAHQRYGKLLKRELRWARSAKQVLLACELVVNLKIGNRWVIGALKADCSKLLSHLNDSNEEEGSLARRLVYMLRHGLESNASLHDSPDSHQHSRVLEYFQSDLPRVLPVPQVIDMSYLSRCDFSSTASNSGHQDGSEVATDTTSWETNSGHIYGGTYTASLATGLSDYISRRLPMHVSTLLDA
jgi:hypothetical protein